MTRGTPSRGGETCPSLAMMRRRPMRSVTSMRPSGRKAARHGLDGDLARVGLEARLTLPEGRRHGGEHEEGKETEHRQVPRASKAARAVNAMPRSRVRHETGSQRREVSRASSKAASKIGAARIAWTWRVPLPVLRNPCGRPAGTTTDCPVVTV